MPGGRRLDSLVATSVKKGPAAELTCNACFKLP